MSLKTWFTNLLNKALPDPAQASQVLQGSTFREAAGVTVDADEDQWRRLSGDANRDLSPMTQQRMQKMAHFLWEQNLLANRLIELPMAYLLAEGVALTVEDEAHQALLEKFWCDPINDMDLKLPKKVRELALFGEQCYPVYMNDVDGSVRIGYLDPALIATVVMDPDNIEQPIGIVTHKDKQGNARRYRVIINGPEEVFTRRTQAIRQSFDTGEAFYFRVNDLSSGSRGRSDLLAQADWLDAYDEFLFGELDRYKHQRAFIWDVTLKGATPEEVKNRAKEFRTPSPASVRVHNDSEEWKAETPDLKAVDTSQGARLFRNHVLGGATMPEHWFGGGGDVNRAVGAEMADPTMKILTMRQRVWKHILESIGRYVLYKSLDAAAGKEVDWSAPEWKVQAIFPELATKDTTKYAAALAQVVAACVSAIAAQLMSQEYAISLIGAVAARLGVEADAEEELLKAQQQASARAEADVLTNPPAGEDPTQDAPMQEAVQLITQFAQANEARLAELQGAIEEARRDGNMDRFVEALAAASQEQRASITALVEGLAEHETRHVVEIRNGKKKVTLPDGSVVTSEDADPGAAGG